MEIKNYSLLAKFYSNLMRKVDYYDWADYITQLTLYTRRKINSVLEIAAGSCAISDLLFEKYDFVVASDLSFHMLQNSKKDRMHKVAADMRQLPFKYKFDFIFSTFDSVNYILTEEELLQFFIDIQSCMHTDTFFAFDVGLELNSIKYERKLNRKGKFNGIKYRQISKYNKEDRIHTNHFIIEDSEGNVFEEIHKQKIYDLIELFEIIENSGMFVVECFDAFSFDDADLTSERAQFLIKKGK